MFDVLSCESAGPVTVCSAVLSEGLPTASKSSLCPQKQMIVKSTAVPSSDSAAVLHLQQKHCLMVNLKQRAHTANNAGDDHEFSR